MASSLFAILAYRRRGRPRNGDVETPCDNTRSSPIATGRGMESVSPLPPDDMASYRDSRLYTAVSHFVISFSRFLYYTILLMRLPSFPFFLHDINHFLEVARLARLHGRWIHIEDAWRKFVSPMLQNWTSAAKDCMGIVFICVLVAPALLPVGASRSNTIATTFSDIACTCSLVSITLSPVLTRHVLAIRDRQDAPHNWYTLTEINAASTFVATPMLLAAPIAWRNWAYVWFGIFIVSLLWRISSSGSMAAYIAGALLELRRSVSGLAAEVESQPPSISKMNISSAARAIVFAVVVVGALHTAFVWAHFSHLGYPASLISRSEETARRSHSRGAEQLSDRFGHHSTTTV